MGDEMNDTPIMFVVLRDGLLRGRCPHCGQLHTHGAAGSKGPDFGHRTAHCGADGGYVLVLTAQIEKVTHLAKSLNGAGMVSAECFGKRRRPIDLSKETWTTRPEAVTCSKCLARIRSKTTDKTTDNAG